MSDVDDDDVPGAVCVLGGDPDRVAADERGGGDCGGVVDFHDGIASRVDIRQALRKGCCLVDVRDISCWYR